jgi:hypothetical protein
MPTFTGATDIYDERIAIILGFLTLLTLLGVFFSIPGKAYSKFPQYHSFFRFSFLALLLVHLVTAILHTGLPQFGDSDAPVHLSILLLGLTSAAVIGAIKKFKLSDYYWWLILLLLGAHIVMSYLHIGVWPSM